MEKLAYPPLFSTTAQAAEAFDRDPLAGKSPKLKALWVGLATMGGFHSAAKACDFARLTGIIDAPNEWLATGLVPLFRTGLVGRLRTPKDYLKTVCTDGHVRQAQWVYFAKNGPAVLDSSRAFRTPLPDKGFIVHRHGLFTHYKPDPNGEGWTISKPGQTDTFAIAKETAWAAWNDKTHTVLSPRF